jgi:hypothetical protein
MGMGYKKMVEGWRAHQKYMREKLRFVVKGLNDKDARFVLMGYNSLKSQWESALQHESQTKYHLKEKFCRSLVDKSFGLMADGFRAMMEHKEIEVLRQRNILEDRVRNVKLKERALKRFLNQNLREQGQALRILRVNCASEIERCQALLARQKGICRRIVDSNARFMGMGYNKLIEGWRVRTKILKDKLRFVMKTLGDKDARFVLMAYNGLKEQALRESNSRAADTHAMKKQILRRMMDSNLNLTFRALELLQKFTAAEKSRSDALLAKKKNVLYKMTDKTHNLACAAFEFLVKWNQSTSQAEKLSQQKFRGVLNRFLDKNSRLTGGILSYLKNWNSEAKTLEARTSQLQKGFIMRAIDANHRLMGQALTSLREHNTLLGQKTARVDKIKKSFINGLINSGNRLMGLGFANFLEFLQVSRQNDEIQTGIGNFKNGVLCGLAKTHRHNESRQTHTALDVLRKWKHTSGLREKYLRKMIAVHTKEDSLN